MSRFPSQSQLLLPLMETLQEAGGQASAKEAADDLATRVGVAPKDRNARVEAGAAGRINAWDRHVRWVRQRAVLKGFITNSKPGVWDLTDRGSRTLLGCRPGVVVTVFETEAGVALWAEAESAVGHFEDGLFNLIMTSPEYPLLRKKDYGNREAKAWIDWMVGLAKSWRRTLADDGSLVLNLGETWQRGQPTQSLYIERLLLRLVDEAGYSLAQRLYWENPSKLPSPAEWVTIRRVRVTPSVEPLLWLSKSPHPKANNRNVLRPYSEQMKKRLRAGGESSSKRPSGHAFAEGSFSEDRGGSIPHSLMILPNTRSNDAYIRACKDEGLPVHPARFPAELPEFFIRLTTDPGDVVYDPFGGSGQTAAVAERLGRRWVMTEKMHQYLAGARHRFIDAPGLEAHVPAWTVA